MTRLAINRARLSHNRHPWQDQHLGVDGRAGGGVLYRVSDTCAHHTGEDECIYGDVTSSRYGSLWPIIARLGCAASYTLLWSTFYTAGTRTLSLTAQARHPSHEEPLWPVMATKLSYTLLWSTFWHSRHRGCSGCLILTLSHNRP